MLPNVRTLPEPPAVRIYNPITEGPVFSFDATQRMEGYRRTIRSMGGYWDGSFLLRGEIGELGQFFDNWLGYRVKETGAGTLTWRGFVWEMQLVHKGVARVRSLLDLSNYVYATYVTTDDPPQVVTSSAAQNALSVARYGRKEQLLLLDSYPQTAAEAKRDTYLTDHAWSYSIPVDVNLDRPLGDTYIEVFLAGDVWTANYRYESVTGLDENQGAISYTDESGAETFTDAGQDFTAWQTTSGNALYSIWVHNSDGSTSWGYLGAKVSNTEIRVYSDQALTTAGWNGDGDTSKTPSSYSIYGPVSEWIKDIVNTDCEFLSVGSIEQNLLQTHQETSIPRRAWDIMKELTELGDKNGNPYRLYADLDGYMHYGQIDTDPLYYLWNGKYYNSAGGTQVEANPWQLQPGVVRDLSYPQKQTEYLPWLTDIRDFYVTEWEVGVNFGARPKTDFYAAEDILTAQMNYNQILMRRRRDQSGGGSGGVVRSGHWQEYGYTQEEWQALPLSERLRIRGIA